MVSIHRYHQISEANRRILNPLAFEQLLLVGTMCDLQPGQRHLDLASGKGEMLCQFAHRHGTTGVGVDVFPPYVAAARERAVELGVEELVEIIEGDAAEYRADPASFDVVSCIGASWIGHGLAGTLELMRGVVRDGGWLLMGEPYWIESPPDEARQALHVGDEFADLAGTAAVFEDAGLDLVEMVLASTETWDRYAANQWLNVAAWLDAHPDDPDAADIRAIRDDARRSYLEHGRRYFGWGVFVLRA